MFGCAKLGGNCPAGYDNSNGYCYNKKYCSAKVPINGNIYICDRGKNRLKR